MINPEIKILYEDDSLLVVDKPAGIVVFPEGNTKEKTLIDLLLDRYPYLKNSGEKPRYGIAHRLDRDTSGILLVAKNDKIFSFLKEQFKKRSVEKKYLALIIGHLSKKEGIIETLIGRSQKNRKKQSVYLPNEPKSEGKRKAITFYKLLKSFDNYDLVEAKPKTGRKHQIRTHFAYIGHPIAGDRIYAFKNQPLLRGLNRQFLHASYLKIKLLNGKIKEFSSSLPKNLKETLDSLESKPS